MRRAAAVAAAVLLAGGAALVAHPPGARRPPEPLEAGAGLRADLGPSVAAPAPARDGPVARRRGRPASLAGTRPDGAVAVDAQGRFRASVETRQLFDYYLSATGEEPVARIRERLVARLRRTLPPTAADEAIALLDRYLTYRDRARDLAAAGTGEAPLAERLDALVRLRREVLGVADAEALFAEEEARDHAALARRHALSDPALSPDARARALDAADAALPESVREADAAATLPMRLDAAERVVRESGASDADVQRLREETVGAEAEARLAALDRERAEWQARIEAYRTARAAIDADATRSAAERNGARAALLAERFTPTEQLRVRALDAAR